MEIWQPYLVGIILGVLLTAFVYEAKCVIKEFIEDIRDEKLS